MASGSILICYKRELCDEKNKGSYERSVMEIEWGRQLYQCLHEGSARTTYVEGLGQRESVFLWTN